MVCLEFTKLVLKKKNVVSVISNNFAPVAWEIIKLTDQVTIRFVSQLNNEISKVMLKLFKYFSGAAV